MSAGSLPRARWLPRLRWFGFALPILSVGVLAWAQPSQATALTAMSSMGHALLKSGTQSVRTIEVNGATLRIFTATTALTPSQELDAFAHRCESGTLNESTGTQRHAIRGGNDRAGFVACTGGQGTFASLARVILAAASFSTTGNASASVPVDYLYAESGPQATHILRFASDVDVDAIFPESGDAPIGAVHGLMVPAPVKSRRVLSLRETGRPYLFSMHASTADVATTDAEHRAQLRASGFAVFDPAAEHGARNFDAHDQTRTFFVHANDLFALVVTKPAKNGGSVTAVASARADATDAIEGLLGATQ